MHRKYLLEIRHLPSKQVTRDRNAIISVLQRDIWFAMMSKTITYKEKQQLIELVRNKLSADGLYGIKQISIFDELDEKHLHPQPEDITPIN